MPASDTVYLFVHYRLIPDGERRCADDRREHRPIRCRRSHVAHDILGDQKPDACRDRCTAARTLIRCRDIGRDGQQRNTWPMMTNGFPGGCGSPNEYAAAMYSLVTIAVDAIVIRLA